MNGTVVFFLSGIFYFFIYLLIVNKFEARYITFLPLKKEETKEEEEDNGKQ